ncbi:MAG: 6-hydroxymethylpterin diphosphokinase MptE-like protein [Vicinamibacterales bacterium]
MPAPPTPDVRTRIDEAAAALAARLGDRPWPSLVVLLGAGTGWAVEAIERDAPPDTRVLVLEPRAADAAALAGRRDWSALVEAGRLRVLVGPDYRGAADAWRMIDPDGPAPLILPHAPLLPDHAADVLAARRIFDRIHFDATANAEARRTLGGRYLVNTLRNLPRMIDAPDIRAWKDARRGAAAIVCGAGPSLDANLRALAGRRDGLVLVAADTAVRPMLESGIEPDFVLALDPSPQNARHLADLPRLGRTWLVCEAALDARAVRSFAPRVAYFRVGHNHPWPWIAGLGLDVAVLPAWGSVLTSAFEFTRWLGCGPIGFIGADLAYSGARTYARGTSFEADWARLVLEGQPLPKAWARAVARRAKGTVDDVAGRPVQTAPHLLAFRDWLVERIGGGRDGTRILNFTGHGVFAGPGITQADPAALDALASRRRSWPDPDRARFAVNRRAFATAAATLDAGTSPMADWLTSYGPSVDRAALDAVVATIASAEAPDQTPPPRPSLPRRLRGLPEAVAIVRAAREGVAPPLWAVASDVWADDLESVADGRAARPRASAADVVAALMAGGRLTGPAAGDVDATTPPPVPGHLDILLSPAWRTPAFEAASAAVIALAGRLRARTVAAPALLRQSITPGPSTAPVETTVHMRPVPLRLWVTSLAEMEALIEFGADGNGNGNGNGSGNDRGPQTDGAASDEVANADAWRRVLDGIDAALAGREGTAASAGADAFAIRLTVDADAGARWRIAAPIHADHRAAILAGAIVGDWDLREQDVSFDARHASVRVRLETRAGRRARARHPAPVPVPAWSHARRLQDDGLPACLIASPFAPDRAIVTPRGGRASFVVDASGSWEAGADWPDPIVGEARGRAGAIAWTHASSVELLHRASDAGPVARAAVPFQPYAIAWLDDRAIVSGSDGLWAWRPGHAPERLADLPPSVLVAIDGGAATLDPLPIVDGRLTRERLTRGWRVDLESGQVAARALPPAGQAWSHAPGPTMDATTFPDADVVRLSPRPAPGSESAPRWLAWPRPRTAVWLGASLLVNTARGDVIVFPDLAIPSDAPGAGDSGRPEAGTP